MISAQRKHIEVVAAVIESETDILCVQRGKNPRAYISGKWEFPGGKVEPGEDHATALIREISEELQVSVTVLSAILTVRHVYPDFDLTMHAYLCTISPPSRSVVLTEHVDLRWLSPASPEFLTLDWAAADIPIVEALQRSALETRAKG